MPALPASWRLPAASASALMNTTRGASSRAHPARTGSIMRHGPHHAAL